LLAGGRRALKDQATRDHHGYDAGIAGDDRESPRRASNAVARRCYMQVPQSLLRLDVPIDKCRWTGTMKAKSLNQVVVGPFW